MQSYTRLRRVVLPFVVITAIACHDSGVPTRPVDRAASTGPSFSAADPGIQGRAVITVRAISATDPVGRVVTVDSGAFAAELNRSGRTTATIRLSSGSVPVDIAADARVTYRSGVWTRTMPGDGPAVAQQFRAANGAPASERTVREGGTIRSREITSWHRRGLYWVVAERTMIVYNDGAPAVSIHISLETSPASAAVLSQSAVTSETEDEYPYGGEEGEEEGDCKAEFKATKKARDEYWRAVALVGAGCTLGGPAGCAAATINLLYSANQWDEAQEEYDECVCVNFDICGEDQVD